MISTYSQSVAGKSAKKLTPAHVRSYSKAYQMGIEAKRKLLDDEVKSGESLPHLEAQALLSELAINRSADLAKPLIIREMNKLLQGSPLKDRDDVKNVLHMAGIEGMRRGLEKFSGDKSGSGLNYIFQWVNAHMKRELMKMEAPPGVPVSRYERYRKISAVRKKMAEQLDREPTDEELLDFFHSGKADQRGFKGKKENANQPSKANRNITMEDLREQINIETYLREVLYDPVGNHVFEKTFTVDGPVIFEETLLGSFADSFDFSNSAKVVLKSELQYSSIPIAAEEAASSMEKNKYKTIAKLWADLLQDPKNIFAVFVGRCNQDDYPEIDLDSIRKFMESSGKTFDPSHYKPIFS